MSATRWRWSSRKAAQLARDAAERIAVEYRPLPAVVDAAAALAPGAPPIWDEAPGNLCYRFQRGDRAAVEAAFAAAAHIVEIELVNNRLVAAADRAAGRDRQLRCGDRLLRPAADRPRRAQHPQPARRSGVSSAAPSASSVTRARCRRRVRHEEFPLSRMGAGAVGGAAARPPGQMGRRARRGIRQRRARPRQPYAGRGWRSTRTAGFSRSMSPPWPISAPICRPTARAARPIRRRRAMGGVYAIPAVFMDVRGAFTNTVPIDAYRGAGKPEANYLIERLIDIAARRLGVRPGRVAPAQPDRRIPLSQRARHHDRLRALCRQSRRGAGAGARRGLCGAARGFRGARPVARARDRLLSRNRARHPERRRRNPLRPGRPRFADPRHPVERSGPRDELSADRRRRCWACRSRCFRLVQADTRAVRSGAGHGGARSMHQGGTALVKAAAAGHRKRPRDRRRPAAGRYRRDRVRGRAGSRSRGREREIDLLSVARAAADPANLPDGHDARSRQLRLQPLGRVHLPERLSHRRGRDRPGNRSGHPRALCRGRRLRAPDQPDADHGPSPRRAWRRASARRCSSTPSTTRIRASC